MQTIDFFLLHTLNQLLHQSYISDWIIYFFAQYAIYFVIYLTILAIIQQKHIRTRIRMIGVSCASVFITHACVIPIIHLYITRTRPFLLYAIPHLFESYTYSFPSGHTAFISTIAGSIYHYRKSYAYVIGILGLIVGVSRVISGVHYMSDVLAGAIFGWVVGYLCSYIAEKIKRYYDI